MLFCTFFWRTLCSKQIVHSGDAEGIGLVPLFGHRLCLNSRLAWGNGELRAQCLAGSAVPQRNSCKKNLCSCSDHGL
jgi:hypothetical protein